MNPPYRFSEFAIYSAVGIFGMLFAIATGFWMVGYVAFVLSTWNAVLGVRNLDRWQSE